MCCIDITSSFTEEELKNDDFWKIRNKKILELINKNELTTPERMFATILNDLHIPYITEIFFNDFTNENGNPYRYDFGIIKKTDDGKILLLCLFEIDGYGHFERDNWKEIDDKKEEFCAYNHIPFSRMNYGELTYNNNLIYKYLMKCYFDDSNFYDIKKMDGFTQFLIKK